MKVGKGSVAPASAAVGSNRVTRRKGPGSLPIPEDAVKRDHCSR